MEGVVHTMLLEEIDEARLVELGKIRQGDVVVELGVVEHEDHLLVLRRVRVRAVDGLERVHGDIGSLRFRVAGSGAAVAASCAAKRTDLDDGG